MVERESGASRLFNILNYVFLAFIGIICLYPFLYVVFASFSDPNQFIKHDFTVLWAPAGFSLEAYKHVFTGELGSGYMNTLIYVVAGTAISMLLTFLGAYVLSRKGYHVHHVLQRWHDTVLPVDQSVGHGGYALGDIAPDGTEHL